MDLVGIALLIFAIAFAVLVVAVVMFLGNLKTLRRQLEETTAEVRQTVKLLTSDLDTTLHHTNQLLVKANVLVEDVNGKVNTIDPVFTTLADLSVSVSDLNQQARKLTSSASQKSSTLTKVGTAAFAAGKLFKGRK